MYLFDVNILVHAHREDSDRHVSIAAFLEETLNAPEPFAYSPLVLSDFLRIVTHPKVFSVPTPLDTAMEFTRSITEHPRSVSVFPGPSHWNIFSHLSYAIKPRGNLFPDTYLAALAVETGCTWVTTDRDFTCFPGLELKLL